MTQSSMPRSPMTASSACRSVVSGVVRTDLIRSGPTRVSIVPMRPVVRSSASSAETMR